MAAPVAHPCIVCGAQTAHYVRHVKWGHRILRCRVCGLGSTARAAGFDPVVQYDAGYFQGARRDGYLDYAGSEAVLRAEFRRTTRCLLRHRPAGGRLLEVGCAYGFFLLEAESYFTCTGIEVSDAAIAECRRRGLAVFRSVDEVANRGPFGAAVLLDCIEHLADPVGMLSATRRVLEPDGVVLITTGDWDSVLARVMGRHWRLLTPPQHLFFFSRTTLPALLERCGFRVVACDRPWKVVPLGLAAYQLGSRLGVRMPLLESIRAGLPVNLFDTIRLVARRS